MADPPTEEGALSWRLSSHPVTLLTYLGFRIGENKFRPCTSASPH